VGKRDISLVEGKNESPSREQGNEKGKRPTGPIGKKSVWGAKEKEIVEIARPRNEGGKCSLLREDRKKFRAGVDSKVEKKKRKIDSVSARKNRKRGGKVTSIC